MELSRVARRPLVRMVVGWDAGWADRTFVFLSTFAGLAYSIPSTPRTCTWRFPRAPRFRQSTVRCLPRQRRTRNLTGVGDDFTHMFLVNSAPAWSDGGCTLKRQSTKAVGSIPHFFFVNVHSDPGRRRCDHAAPSSSRSHCRWCLRPVHRQSSVSSSDRGFSPRSRHCSASVHPDVEAQAAGTPGV